MPTHDSNDRHPVSFADLAAGRPVADFEQEGAHEDVADRLAELKVLLRDYFALVRRALGDE